MKHFMRVLVQFLSFLYCTILWRALKFFTHKVTGRCELQRICHSHKPGARRTLMIEKSLKSSKSELLQSAVCISPDVVEKVTDDIMTLKRISQDTNLQLSVSLQGCLYQVVGYRALQVEVEKLRRENYDSDNPQHEDMLLKLWRALCPDTPLTSRVSKQWSDIGFQGSDPKTDFRGMGVLGLLNLLYFAEHDRTAALQVLHDSQQPKHRGLSNEEVSNMSPEDWKKNNFDKAIGFSFAIVGINITDLTFKLLLDGALKTHLYNIAPEMPSLAHFHQTFCYLMQEFHSFWVEENPSDIMEFNRVREKFYRMVLKQLQDPNMALCQHSPASQLHLISM